MNAGGGIPLPPPNLRQAADRTTEIDLCPIERMERALDREIGAMGVKCHVPAGGIVPSAFLWLLGSYADMAKCRTKLRPRDLVTLIRRVF
jgi:hypothetical protein